jgi:hypothetical protein
MAHGRNSLTATTTNSTAYNLKIAQEPQQAKVYLQRDKGMNLPKVDLSGRTKVNRLLYETDRKPLEPPPVIEILLDDNDPYK